MKAPSGRRRPSAYIGGRNSCKAKREAPAHSRRGLIRFSGGEVLPDQRVYTREEVLFAQVEELLGRIALTEEEVDALIADAHALELRSAGSSGTRAAQLKCELAAMDTRSGRLLDGFLDGTVPAAAYRSKADSLDEQREVVQRVLWNLTISDGRIASYQLKRPFAVLEKDPSGAFVSSWWAM